MRTLRLTESTDTIVTLTTKEAISLREIGQVLASRRSWWGDAEEEPTKRTVVRCNPVNDTEYRLWVSDAIGVIGLGETQLIIHPKIALPHLLYLFAQSGEFPRHLLERTRLGEDANFFTVIAAWFIEACEVLLRHGLVSDYARTTDDLACARGRIHTVATARSVMIGRPVIRCDYDLRSEDTSLNRVTKAASLILLGAPGLPDDLRARTRRIQYRLSDIGDLRYEDRRARPETLTRIYRDVHPLALLLLDGRGVAMHEGERSTWTFLCRTPDAVEIGVRNSLSQRLGTDCDLAKRGRRLLGSRSRTVNPDLVFGNTTAVGDVKYKITSEGSIARADLNQVTTFATAYGAEKAVVIAFGADEIGEKVRVGPVDVNGVNWNFREPVPSHAADRLAEHVAAWLSGAASAPAKF